MSSECRRYQMDLSTSLDGELDTEETRALFLHLAECEGCRLFWNAVIRIERELLKEERISGSTSLDARVASIGRSRGPGGLGGKPEESFLRPQRDRGATRQSAVREKVTEEVKSFPYSLAAITFLLAVALGFILGTVQLWSSSATIEREPRVVYVSVLPDITVVAHPPVQTPKRH